MSILKNRLKYIAIFFTVAVLFFLSLEVYAQYGYMIPQGSTTRSYTVRLMCMPSEWEDFLACGVSADQKCVSRLQLPNVTALDPNANESADCSQYSVALCLYGGYGGYGETQRNFNERQQGDDGSFPELPCRSIPVLQRRQGTLSTDPIKVRLGEKQTDAFKIQGLDGYSISTLECKNCLGQDLQYTSGDEFTVEFDSSSSGVAVGLNEIVLRADLDFNVTRSSLPMPSFEVSSAVSFEFRIYYMVFIDCDPEIAGMNCKTDQTQPTQLACKQKCEAKNYCKYVNGQCKFDGDVTAQERAQLGEEAVMGWIKEEYAVDPNYQGPIPPCAFTGTCRNTNDFLLLFLRWSKTIFAAIAAFAFTFFVIGGFIILISFGNAEKVKKGQGILGAAVIGMVIVFGAYMMINFLMESLGIRADFRGF